MSTAGVAEMRKETVNMFYHGYDNYMKVAFPEDEVSILSSYNASVQCLHSW